MRRGMWLVLPVAALLVAVGAYVGKAANAGSHLVAANETFTVPDTSVQITNSSTLPQAGPVGVSWDDNSANIRLTVTHDTVTTLLTDGTSVTATVNGANASLATSGGMVSLIFSSSATNGTATVDGTQNSIHCDLGSTGNTATCNGDNNVTDSDRDPTAQPSGNVTIFSGSNNVSL